MKEVGPNVVGYSSMKLVGSKRGKLVPRNSASEANEPEHHAFVPQISSLGKLSLKRQTALDHANITQDFIYPGINRHFAAEGIPTLQLLFVSPECFRRKRTVSRW